MSPISNSKLCNIKTLSKCTIKSLSIRHNLTWIFNWICCFNTSLLIGSTKAGQVNILFPPNVNSGLTLWHCVGFSPNHLNTFAVHFIIAGQEPSWLMLTVSTPKPDPLSWIEEQPITFTILYYSKILDQDHVALLQSENSIIQNLLYSQKL